MCCVSQFEYYTRCFVVLDRWPYPLIKVGHTSLMKNRHYVLIWTFQQYLPVAGNAACETSQLNTVRCLVSSVSVVF